MSRPSFLVVCGLIGCVSLWAATSAQPRQPAAKAPPDPVQERLVALAESVGLAEESLAKKVDEEVLFRRLADLAEVDKVRYTGPPPRVIKNLTAQGAGNPVILTAYTFFPRKRPTGAKLPLVVLVHGGVHGNFNSNNVHVLRELLAQGYAVLAPEYRGSSGYGQEFRQLIDYGGLEVEDVFAGKQWVLENHPDIDSKRVGIMGWSHGGLITLMNLFAHPKDFQVGYAGVPVCDLVARMGYKSQGYRELFSAPYHIGKKAEEDVNEYRRRSPAWNAEKLRTPLLIHTTTNDEDVNVLEVEHLIKALKAEGKTFEHRVYKDAPGGHAFNRLDTRLAKESRAEVYRFLAKHLSPPDPVK
ncbi:MAG TPA: alpha/beta fold hydrolase [Gemmataceae bacterium]|nr:alpha/beta fold hydrolase [Gemmataceae bacterium]